jgi:hypothetical protein
VRIRSTNPARLIEILDAVYGVEAKHVGDWVEIGTDAHPNLQDWIRSDWPELLVLDQAPIDPANHELLMADLEIQAPTQQQRDLTLLGRSTECTTLFPTFMGNLTS